MGECNMEDMPLPALFEQARKIHAMATEPATDQELVKKGCEALQKCEDMVNKLGLFSANETKDDISTSNLNYILVPFYLAKLAEKIAQDDRIQILNEFISFCETMELVPKEVFESYTQGAPQSVADQRIARFKRQRAAESKLLEIKVRKERCGRSTKAATLSTPVEAGEEEVLDDDGEEEREAWNTTISLAICKARDLLQMLKKEEEMLSVVKDRQSKVVKCLEWMGIRSSLGMFLMNAPRKQKLGIVTLQFVHCTLNHHAQLHVPLLLKMF